jgi:excisionase family DNA binding protein
MVFVAPFDGGGELLSLPEVAQRLGVHRTAVNAMVLDGRLAGERHGPYWRVRRDVCDAFVGHYRRPANVPVPQRHPDALPPVAERALGWLVRWGEGTTAELREVMTDAPGNVRKATDILSRRGWAVRDSARVWRPTEAGRLAARRLGMVDKATN